MLAAWGRAVCACSMGEGSMCLQHGGEVCVLAAWARVRVPAAWSESQCSDWPGTSALHQGTVIGQSAGQWEYDNQLQPVPQSCFC